jgi:predicted HD superfamily hydrolase involved in NAD metabolism
MPGSELQRVTREVADFLAKNLSKKRYEHSLSTAEFARGLALKFGADADLVYLAALAHDMAKELSPEEQLRLCKLDGDDLSADPERALSPCFSDVPGLRHGPAAEILLREHFRFDNAEVAAAVRWHTTGHRDMGLVAKIVYVADKIEPGRKGISPEFRGDCLMLGLDEMLLFVLERDIEITRKKGRVAPETLSLYNAIHG